MDDPVKRNYAIEEWKHLESLIGRHEQITFQMRGWLYALITALIVLFMGTRTILSSHNFFIIGIVLVVLFLCMEIVQRVPLHRAVKRVKSIEASIRGAEEYDGPKMSVNVAEGCDVCDALRELLVFRVWFPYLILIIIIFVVTFFAPKPVDPADAAKTSPLNSIKEVDRATKIFHE